MLTIALLNENAQLNDYSIVETKDYIPNLPLKLNIQIGDNETGLRLMAQATPSKMNLIFQNSDGTELTKAAAAMFNPADMSMWTVSLTASESNAIVGSNFQVVLDMAGDSTLPDLSDATDLRSGMAYSKLSKITFDGEC
jgi:hypothetical protein